MKRILQLLGGLLLVLVLLVAAIVGFAVATEYSPGPVEEVAVDCAAPGEGLAAGQPFTVLSWNLQYGASRKHRFFYDGGEVVHVPPADVAETVGAIADVLQTAQPDLALLQEVDRDSDRTGNIDQLPPYLDAMGAGCHARTSYHKSPYVPNPPGKFLGGVDMQLATASKGPMAGATRIQLALLDEPRVRQIFNLKRAVLTTEIPVEGWDQPLAVANTHLSAFSFGDGTLERQIDALVTWIEARPADQPWIVAGDFNLLPPGFDKERLTSERDLYADADNPIEKLLPLGTLLTGDPLAAENHTYLPYGAQTPDRKIDYVLVGGPITVLDGRVLSEHDQISDHLPLTGTLVIGPPPPPAEEAPAEDAPAEDTPAEVK